METMAAQQIYPETEHLMPSPNAPAPAPIWLQRMSLVVFVLFCFYIGGLMTVLPWWQKFWDQNAWLMAHPAVDALLLRGWVRGLVSGIGLVDVWIGISELINYRDYRG